MIEVEAKIRISEPDKIRKLAGKIGKFKGRVKKIDDYYTLEDLKNRSIVCAGVTCGSVPEMAAYTDLMCSTLGGIPSQFAHDQAVHNVLVYKCLAHVRVFANEESPVYTVGYLPRESVQVVDGLIHNKAGKVPAVVHQWDRHNNLVALVKERYG